MKAEDFNTVEENSLYFLYRRGEPEHLLALFEKGEVFINTIDYIRECDRNEDRADPHDGIDRRHFVGDV